MQSPSASQLPKAGPAQLSQMGIGLSLIMVVIGWAWVGIGRGRNVIDEWFATDLSTGLVDVIVGLLVGSGVAVLVTNLGHRVEAFNDIRDVLASRLDFAQFRWWDCVWLSVLAAGPEEILFRGAMQPVFGLIITAVIFGALHAVTKLYFVYATLAGLLLGLLYQINETLWAPMAAHFAVDYLSLIWMLNWARTQAVAAADPLADWLAFGIADRENDLETL